LKGLERTESPPSENRPDSATTERWHFIHRRQHEMVRHVGRAPRPVKLPMILVHVAPGRSVFIRRLHIVHESRLRVVREHREAVGEAFFHTDERADGFSVHAHYTKSR